MTVRRRMSLQVMLLSVSIGLLAAIAVYSVARLRENFGVALSANQQLRELFTIGTHVSAARSMLQAGSADAGQRELQAAVAAAQVAAAELAALPQFRSLSENLEAAATAEGRNVSAIEMNLDRVLHTLADSAASVRLSIAEHQRSADELHHRTLIEISATSLAAFVATLSLCAWHYRALTQPLGALQKVAGRLAANDFSQRADTRGDAEFASLATAFNQMADELSATQAELESRVARKSRELGQAQRLASIGYLAAGVAHEINNPLGIIAGYGQRTLRRLDGEVDVEKIKQSIGVICDEAFRCKKITDRLLMLARPPSTQSRQAVDLSSLIEQTIATLAALRPLEGREITCDIDNQQLGPILADADALRQVLLNLLINAVEATEKSRGRITIESHRTQESIAISIRDNGRGISADMLPRIFEPFVTDQRDRPGTGLGLAIALSIISDHGGTITACSDGVGRGSEFRVSLLNNRNAPPSPCTQGEGGEEGSTTIA